MSRRELLVTGLESGQVPFLEQALERGIVSKGLSYEITEVVESRKRTGYLLKSTLFIIFLWKSSPILDPLLAELEALTRTNPAEALYVELTDTSVEGFEVWFDNEVERMWTKGKKSNVLERYSAHLLQPKGNGRKKAPV
jgi:hypothetical protein